METRADGGPQTGHGAVGYVVDIVTVRQCAARSTCSRSDRGVGQYLRGKRDEFGHRPELRIGTSSGSPTSRENPLPWPTPKVERSGAESV